MRASGGQLKVHFKGDSEDFVVYVEDEAEYESWKKDKTIPLVQVVGTFKVFVSHKHGNQGEHETASKAQLENEFNTSNEDEVIKIILEKGDFIKGSNNKSGGGDRNITQGGTIAH